MWDLRGNSDSCHSGINLLVVQSAHPKVPGMINQWSLGNFKSIREGVDLDFAPLTLFVGQNSAGKSTLIQSILMTAQTLQSNAATRSVILNGRILRLGEFSDIRSNGSSGNPVTIKFELGRNPFTKGSSSTAARQRAYYTVDYQEQMKSVCCSFSFSAGEGAGNKELQLQPRIERGYVKYETDDPKDDLNLSFYRVAEPRGVILHKLNVSADRVRLPDISALDFNIVSEHTDQKFYRNYRLPANSTQAGVVLRHFLPVQVGVAYDAVEVEVNSMFDVIADTSSRFSVRPAIHPKSIEALNSPLLQNIIFGAARDCVDATPSYSRARIIQAYDNLTSNFNLDSLFRFHAVLNPQLKKNFSIQLTEKERTIKDVIRGNRAARKEIAPVPVTDPITFATDYITTFFAERVKYLGPLRDEPKAIYPLAGYNDPRDVGYRGEYTAAVLDNNKTEMISYVSSGSFPLITNNARSIVSRPLVDAVRDWLEYLGIAAKVATEDKGKLGHEMTIATSDSAALHDLTHVGVGVSQALPIVVLSLLADAGSTLIFEQPELHLHPKVQTRLADFFMSLILAGKQCIVETHSEYLISRLRYLSSVSEDIDVSKNIKIYFVEKPAHQSQYNEVTILDTGALSNWPDGFFDESERNATAIVQAQIQKAKKRRDARKMGGGGD